MEGVYCTLLTGQEKQEVVGASHVACTVEMVNVFQHSDVAGEDDCASIVVIMVIAAGTLPGGWLARLAGSCLVHRP